VSQSFSVTNTGGLQSHSVSCPSGKRATGGTYSADASIYVVIFDGFGSITTRGGPGTATVTVFCVQ